jgi:hypothetical protein
MRIAFGILAAAIVAVAGALFYLSSNLDSLVKDAIETYGSEIVGTRVRVASVKITLSEGTGSIRDLRIGNPSGFSSGDAFRLREITLGIDVDPATIGEEPYVIDVIRIIAPEVNAEVNATGGTNIQVIQKNVESYAGTGGGAGGTHSGDTRDASDPAPRIRIGELVFEKAKLAADTTALGGKAVDLSLPPLRLTKLGGNGGKAADAIAQQVLEAYSKVVAKAIARELVQGKVGSLIDDKIGGTEGEAVKGLLKGLLK